MNGGKSVNSSKKTDSRRGERASWRQSVSQRQKSMIWILFSPSRYYTTCASSSSVSRFCLRLSDDAGVEQEEGEEGGVRFVLFPGIMLQSAFSSDSTKSWLKFPARHGEKMAVI